MEMEETNTNIHMQAACIAIPWKAHAPTCDAIEGIEQVHLCTPFAIVTHFSASPHSAHFLYEFGDVSDSTRDQRSRSRPFIESQRENARRRYFGCSCAVIRLFIRRVKLNTTFLHNIFIRACPTCVPITTGRTNYRTRHLSQATGDNRQ